MMLGPCLFQCGCVCFSSLSSFRECLRPFLPTLIVCLLPPSLFACAFASHRQSHCTFASPLLPPFRDTIPPPVTGRYTSNPNVRLPGESIHLWPNTEHHVRKENTPTHAQLTNHFVCNHATAIQTILSHQPPSHMEVSPWRTSSSRWWKNSGDAVSVTGSHDWWLIHQIASDLRQHSFRRNETVLDGGDNLILVRAVLEFWNRGQWHTVTQVCHKILTTLGERLSQARNRLQTASRQVERASFTVEWVHLQVHRLTQFRSCEQKGTALGGSPLPVHVVAPTELHDDRTSGTSTRMKDFETVAWISSWSEQYWRELIWTSFTQSLKSTERSWPLLEKDFPKQEILSRPLPVISIVPASFVKLSTFTSTVSPKSAPL